MEQVFRCTDICRREDGKQPFALIPCGFQDIWNTISAEKYQPLIACKILLRMSASPHCRRSLCRSVSSVYTLVERPEKC